jgi:hypothetical protein
VSVNVAALYTPPAQWTPPAWEIPRPEEPTVTFDRNEPAVYQQQDWTCSCASMAWVMNALGVPSPGGGKWNEYDAVDELRRITSPGAVSPSYGLANGSGIDLVSVYHAYGYEVRSFAWPDWATIEYVLERTIAQMGGARWYHWSGVRGTDGEGFNLANPSPSYKGVGQYMDSYEWDSLGGWNVLAITGKI